MDADKCCDEPGAATWEASIRAHLRLSTFSVSFAEQISACPGALEGRRFTTWLLHRTANRLLPGTFRQVASPIASPIRVHSQSIIRVNSRLRFLKTAPSLRLLPKTRA